VHARLVGFHGLGHREQVFGGQRGVRVALPAGPRQVQLADWRVWGAGGHDLVRGPVAALAGRSIPVQVSVRSSMNAGRELFDFICVAGGAEGGAAGGRLNNLVGAPMASHARFGTARLSERRVSAGHQLPGDFSVAGKARGPCALCRVWELGCPCVAIHAANVFVDAMCERLRLDGDGLALRVRQTGGWSVAGKAIV
jgi:hypothetical protein